jgi:glutaredoxin-like protein NrdH
MQKKVVLYALSTCGWCRRTKKLLDDNAIVYEVHDVDTLVGEERRRINAEASRWNPRASFPTIVIDDGATVIVGFDEARIREALGL